MRRASTPTGSRVNTPRLSAHTPRGTPSAGTPRGTPTQGTPRQGTPRQGTPQQGTPRQGGTPRQSNMPTPRVGTPRSSNNNPAPSANATGRFSPQRTYTTPTRTYTTPRRHIPDASPQPTGNSSSIRRTPLRVSSDTGRLGRRPSPLMYRGNPPEHALHSGLISNNGLVMRGGKARSVTPSSSDVIAPKPLTPGEKPDPLMFISKMGSPIVCRGMGAAKPPETKEWHPGRKAYAPGPPDSFNVFYSTPKQTPTRRICIAPSTHDIPGLNDGGRPEPKHRPAKRPLDGPPVFEPPPFEKYYTPARRQNYVKVEHDVLLQRPATSITPFRSGARSASPVLSRYNNMT